MPTPASRSSSGRHGAPRSSRPRPRASRAPSTRRPAVKQAVCGYGRADKGQVARMVRMLLALPDEPATSHEADALAVAICHAMAPPLARMAS